MSKKVLRWAVFLSLDAVIAAGVYLAYFQGHRGLLLLKDGGEGPKWLNVTPGYRDTIPQYFVMKYSPWPLPRQENISAITGITIPPGEPVILKGRSNKVRYWNFVLYPSHVDTHNRQLPEIDSFNVDLETDGAYVITLSPTKAAKNWLNTGDATGGILFMRNYVPAPHSRIVFPDVYVGDRRMVQAKEIDYVD